MNNTGQLPLFGPTADNFADIQAFIGHSGVGLSGKSAQRSRRSNAVQIKTHADSLVDMSAEELESAPSTFKELCRFTSVREAVTLCEQLGGLKLRIPPLEAGNRWKNTELRTKLKAILSVGSYEHLLRELGGTGSEITFPSLVQLKKRRRDRRIRQMVDALCAQKKPYLKALQSIAREEGLHMTTIYKILKQSD